MRQSHGGSAFVRAFIALLAVALALAACAGETVPAPDSTGPVGALYGNVRAADGGPATDAKVHMFQLTREDELRTGIAVATLGILCLAPGFCPTPVNAEVSSQGAFSFPTRVMKKTPYLTITANRWEADRDSDASVSASFRRRSAPQRAPDLTFWQPKVRLTVSGTRARVSWTALRHSPTGPRVTYSIGVVAGDDAGEPRQVGRTTRESSAYLDLRPYEDSPAEVVVVAGTEASVSGREVEYAYTSDGQDLPLTQPPPSRDRPCLVDDARSGRLVPVSGRCGLTDGDLETQVEVLASGECSADSKPCEPPTHHRVCVDLGSPRRVSLVDFRTPFALDVAGIRAELSSDGRQFTTVGVAHDDQDIFSVPVRPVRSARFACLRGAFSGSQLQEVSAW
ncbi:MAG TPA: hypothetical protein VE287_07940 [Actinopolymorphaceae bacterium]|nr:hypothetical protein [Actinopolymorphaceae bacterium]